MHVRVWQGHPPGRHLQCLFHTSYMRLVYSMRLRCHGSSIPFKMDTASSFDAMHVSPLSHRPPSYGHLPL